MNIRPVRVTVFHSDVLNGLTETCRSYQSVFTNLLTRQTTGTNMVGDYSHEKLKDYKQNITQGVIFGSLYSTATNSGIFS